MKPTEVTITFPGIMVRGGVHSDTIDRLRRVEDPQARREALVRELTELAWASDDDYVVISGRTLLAYLSLTERDPGRQLEQDPMQDVVQDVVPIWGTPDPKLS